MSASRRFRPGIPVLATLAVLAGAPAARAQYTVPTGFTIEQVLYPPYGGSTIGFAFLPDTRILVIEKQSGGVRVKLPADSTSSLIATVPDVVGNGFENGTLGIAVDPDWPARPYVYVYYNHTGGTVWLTMYTITGDLTDPGSANLSFTSPYHLITDVPDNNPVHQAGTLRFGPDGMLYLSQGDDSDPCAAQDLSVLGGQILRLDVSAMPGAGTGPPPKADLTPSDNPFVGSGDNEGLVWAWGFRNPFRFTIDAPTGDLFVGDVGADAFEELDRVQAALGGGENFGWPQLEALTPWDQCPACSTCGLGNTFTDPIHYYPHTGDIHSIVAGPRYRAVPGGSANFPPEYEGSVFFLRIFDGVLRRLVDTGSGWEFAAPVPGQPSAEDWATVPDQISDCQLGPDGALYLMRIYGTGTARGLWRIAPSEGTGAPVVAAAAGGGSIDASPNPALATTGTTIRWNGASVRTVRIVDAAGRLVRRLQAGGTPDGSVRWDGRSDAGIPVPGGIYFLRALAVDGRELSGKVSILR
jgi:Glucose / Sorbosone dehydrogenase/FlgD Ig-like domain